MIQVMGIASATTANLLAGSDLQSAPSQGIVICWVASTVADSIVNFGAPPRIALRNVTPHIRANGVPLCSDDSPVAIAVNGGEQIILQVTEVTAMTFGYVVKFIPQAEL